MKIEKLENYLQRLEKSREKDELNNKKSYERMAEKAFNEGITHKQTKGRLNKWITSLYFKEETANNIRIYGDNAYIFCDETLVTVIPVPAGLRKNLKKMTKEIKL